MRFDDIGELSTEILEERRDAYKRALDQLELRMINVDTIAAEYAVELAGTYVFYDSGYTAYYLELCRRLGEYEEISELEKSRERDDYLMHAIEYGFYVPLKVYLLQVGKFLHELGALENSEIGVLLLKQSMAYTKIVIALPETAAHFKVPQEPWHDERFKV